MAADPENNPHPGDAENALLRKILNRLSGITSGSSSSVITEGSGPPGVSVTTPLYTDTAASPRLLYLLVGGAYVAFAEIPD